jgi:hypothetical protein
MQAGMYHRLELAMLAVALVSMAAGVTWGLVDYFFYAAATKTDGQIVEVLERRSNGTSAFSPVFVFSDRDGVSHRIVSNTYSKPSMWSVGDRIRVAYAENDPTNCVIDSFMYIWFFPMMLMIAGLFPLVFWIPLFRYMRSKISADESGGS